jgi:hypothetical protein
MYRRRRLMLMWSAAVIVVAIAIFTAVKWPGYAIAEPEPAPTIVTPTPAPTPTAEPLARAGEHTPLVDALPDAVREYTQQGIVNLPGWQEENGATESWAVTYADAAIGAPGARIMLLETGQWSLAEDARSFANAHIIAAGEPVRSGDVTVDGKVTGTYAVFDSGDGMGSMWWVNDTVVLHIMGTADEVTEFYSAYPL